MDAAMEEKSFACPTLAEGIGEDYRAWTPYGEVKRRMATRVFIESPDGTEKAAFIFGTLFPYAVERRRTVVYLAPRAALPALRQCALACGLQPRTDAAGGESFCLPGKLYGLTLLAYADVLRAEAGLAQTAYVVMDDVHVLLEDALFNARTDRILRAVIRSAPGAVWVCLSATMQEIAPVLRERADAVLPENYVDNALSRQLLQRQYLYYRNAFRANGCAVRFFRSDDTLLRAIAAAPREEKWLVFTPSLHRGRSLQQQLRARTGRSAAFLSSESKGGKLWETLVREGRFEQEVLVATKVLDSGVCVTDAQVRHVVLPFGDGTELGQLLSRCRPGEGQTLHVYAEVPPIQKINTLLAGVRRRIAVMCEVRDCYPRQRTALLQRLWEEGRPEVNCLFSINDDGVLEPNALALEKLRRRETFYAELAAHYREEGYYERTVLAWLGNTADTPRFLGADTPEEGLRGFLRRYAGVLLPAEEWEAFYQAFETCFAQECAARFAPDSAELEAARTIRKGTTQRKATVNRQLRLLNEPYTLKKEHNCWVLRQET